MKNLRATWISALVVMLGLTATAKQSNCGSNHSCKKVFYLLSDYHEDDKNIDKHAFIETTQALFKEGAVIYRIGDTIKVYMPHDDLFFKRSSNLKPGQDKKWRALGTLIDIYKPSQIIFKALVANGNIYNPDKPVVDDLDLARKQTSLMSRKLHLDSRLRNIEFITSDSTIESPDLEFWKVNGQNGRKKIFTMIEFIPAM